MTLSNRPRKTRPGTIINPIPLTTHGQTILSGRKLTNVAILRISKHRSNDLPCCRTSTTRKKITGLSHYLGNIVRHITGGKMSIHISRRPRHYTIDRTTRNSSLIYTNRALLNGSNIGNFITHTRYQIVRIRLTHRIHRHTLINHYPTTYGHSSLVLSVVTLGISNLCINPTRLMLTLTLHVSTHLHLLLSLRIPISRRLMFRDRNRSTRRPIRRPRQHRRPSNRLTGITRTLSRRIGPSSTGRSNNRSNRGHQVICALGHLSTSLTSGHRMRQSMCNRSTNSIGYGTNRIHPRQKIHHLQRTYRHPTRLHRPKHGILGHVSYHTTRGHHPYHNLMRPNGNPSRRHGRHQRRHRLRHMQHSNGLTRHQHNHTSNRSRRHGHSNGHHHPNNGPLTPDRPVHRRRSTATSTSRHSHNKGHVRRRNGTIYLHGPRRVLLPVGLTDFSDPKHFYSLLGGDSIPSTAIASSTPVLIAHPVLAGRPLSALAGSSLPDFSTITHVIPHSLDAQPSTE